LDFCAAVAASDIDYTMVHFQRFQWIVQILAVFEDNELVHDTLGDCAFTVLSCDWKDLERGVFSRR
jgi:hypothetical protein